jgi:DNA-binding beta-propeller fold protein YncE
VDRSEFLGAAAATALAAAFCPDALARRLGGPTVALVTADREASILAVDLATGRVLRRIRTLTEPRSIETVGPATAVVAHTTRGAVSIVDTSNLEVRRVLSGFAEPRYTAAHPTAGLAYVTDSKRGEVVTVDVGLGRIVHRTRVPGPARHVSIAPGGAALWTVLGSKAGSIALLDTRNPRRPRLVRELSPPFLAHDVALAPDGRHIWVTSGSERAIALYAPGARKPTRTIEADAAPQHVTFARGLAYVASGDDGTLRVHRAADGLLLHTAGIPVGSYNVSFGARRAVTPSLERGTICIADGRGRILEVRRIASAAHDACVVHEVHGRGPETARPSR